MSKLFRAKNRFRPLYKKFLRVRENVQNRPKLLKFKKKKWEKQIHFYKRKLRRYKKFRPIDQTQYFVSKYPSKWYSYKKRFGPTLNEYRKFRLFYGNLTKKTIKKQIYVTLKTLLGKLTYSNVNSLFLELFESRLDTVLYRSKFSFSLRNSRQLIVHGKVMVNKKVVNSPSFKLKPGDFISIIRSSKMLIEENLRRVQIWPIPPKHLLINYRTLEIIFTDIIQKTNLSVSFPFKFNLEKVLINYYRR